MTGERPALIAYDGSEPAQAAIEAAGRLLSCRRAIVLNVHEGAALPVVPPAGPGMAAAPAMTDPERMDALAEEAASHGRDLAEEGARIAERHGLSATAETRAGSGGTSGVWSVIVETAAGADAEVIVVGTRGRSGIAAALLGSVSNGVLHHADRPVLVVGR